eukprot:3800151-Rhodomonas_salina.1
MAQSSQMLLARYKQPPKPLPIPDAVQVPSASVLSAPYPPSHSLCRVCIVPGHPVLMGDNLVRDHPVLMWDVPPPPSHAKEANEILDGLLDTLVDGKVKTFEVPFPYLFPVSHKLELPYTNTTNICLLSSTNILSVSGTNPQPVPLPGVRRLGASPL